MLDDKIIFLNENEIKFMKEEIENLKAMLNFPPVNRIYFINKLSDLKNKIENI